ncbi:MAG: amidohydrolase family protein [Thermodesulfobacteriota bacterium]
MGRSFFLIFMAAVGLFGFHPSVQSEETMISVINVHMHLIPSDVASEEAWLKSAETYIRQMDEAGMETAVNLLMQNFRQKSPNEVVEKALAHNRVVRQKYPGRFITFAGIDPRLPEKEYLELLEKAVKVYGCTGIGELVCQQWKVRLSDPQYKPYLSKVQELGVPLLMDGTYFGSDPMVYSHPDVVEALVRAYPGLQICVGGTGANMPPVILDGRPIPARERFLQLAEKYPNLWLDLDDWQLAEGPGIGELVRFVKKAMAGPARTRIMFGSDFPVPSLQGDRNYREVDFLRNILSYNEKEGIGIMPEEWDLFFHLNAGRFLNSARKY